jgi:hypothetical protein
METGNQEVKVFTGTAKDAKSLRSKLEEHSIPSQIRDEAGSKEIEGLNGTPPANVDLFVNNSHIRNADPVIKDFRDGIGR